MDYLKTKELRDLSIWGWVTAQWAKAGAGETLVDPTMAKTERLGRAKGIVTAANSDIRMEAVMSASGTAAGAVSKPMSLREVYPAEEEEIADAEAAAVEPNCSSAARPEGLMARNRRTA